MPSTYKGPISVVTVLFKPSKDRRQNISPASRNVGFDHVWVNRLYAGMRRHLKRDMRFVLLTDQPDLPYKPKVEVVPFTEGWKDWWTINEIFRPDLKLGRTIFLGLDTVIMGSMEDVVSFDGVWEAPRHPPKPRVFNNAVCNIDMDHPVAKEVWDLAHDKQFMRTKCLLPVWNGKGRGNIKVPSEMMLWRRVVTPHTENMSERCPGQVCSFGTEYRHGYSVVKRGEKIDLGDRRGVRAVYFHGRIKVHNLPRKRPNGPWKRVVRAWTR